MPQKVPHEIDILVGRNILRIRESICMTRVQLGQQVGVSYHQIEKYEKGRNRVSASRLWEISQALDTPITYFYNGSGLHQAPKNHLDSQETHQLIKTYYNLPNEDQRKSILKMMKTL
jgi:transcriptional regulator with XRE-family HTH domain